MKTKKAIELKWTVRGAGDLRIKHFKSIPFAPVKEFTHHDEQLFFLSAFTGLRYNQCLDFLETDIKKMVALALSAISKMDLKSKLPDVLILGGKKFYLAQPDKIGIGWHIDFGKCNIEKDPTRMACLFYLPEGYNYSDIDENNNITHPIDSRYQLFADEFPLDLFIRAASFFLQRSLDSILKQAMISKKLTLKERISLVTKVINPLRGKQVLKRSRKRSTSRGIKH